MGKSLKEKITRAVFVVAFSGENGDPVLKIKICSRWNKKISLEFSAVSRTLEIRMS